jgi:serine/threonine-protein kinase
VSAPVRPRDGPDTILCARCRARAPKSALAAAGYSCPCCKLALAHLHVAADGAIRGVIGWLRPPGALLEDRYRIVDLLARGGTSVTYLAEDLLLGGRRRALAEVPEPHFDEVESRILSRVQHPALPEITDRFGLERMVYLVLRFDGSQTLEGVRRGNGGRLEIGRVGPWVAELCDALACLRAQEPPIAHRDLRPESILLDETGRIVLVDVGIARAGLADPRSDVYALAATIYALLTGATPPAARERASGAEVRPPSALVDGLPAGLDDVLLAALGPDPRSRPPSIRDFERAFFGALGGAARRPTLESA